MSPATSAQRRVVVLGATGTIGGAITRDLLAAGASVVATGRSPDALTQLGESGAHVLPLALTGTSAGAMTLRDACATALDGAVDGIVVCTGAHGPIGRLRDVDVDELADFTAAHMVGVTAAIAGLAPLLDAGARPAIVVMSGGGATGPRARYDAYAMAKVALVRLVENLAIEEPRWRINAVAPGFVASAIHDTTLAAGAERSGDDPAALRARMEKADDITRVTGLVAALLAADGPALTGRLISAQWDPWDDAAWIARVADDPSLCRLRRIDDQQFTSIN